MAREPTTLRRKSTVTQGKVGRLRSPSLATFIEGHLCLCLPFPDDPSCAALLYAASAGRGGEERSLPQAETGTFGTPGF